MIDVDRVLNTPLIPLLSFLTLNKYLPSGISNNGICRAEEFILKWLMRTPYSGLKMHSELSQSSTMELFVKKNITAFNVFSHKTHLSCLTEF